VIRSDVEQEKAAAGSLEPAARQMMRGFLGLTVLDYEGPGWMKHDDAGPLQLLWGLHVTGGVSEEDTLTLLKMHSNREMIRAWAIQLACEDKKPSAALLKEFARLARALWGPSPDGGTAVQGSVVFFTLLFTIVYTTTLHTVAGQTIGKSLMGVRVVSAADGTLLTVGPALLRHLAYALSAMPLGFGFLMAGLRRDKRALHDLIAGSRVEWTTPRRAVRRAAAPPPGPSLQDAAVTPAPDPGPGA